MKNKSSQDKIIDPKIDDLLSKYESSRHELLSYLTDLDKLRSKVEAIFPQTIDYRSKFVLEEKIKTMSAFYSTMLNVRQEYNRSLKDEIGLRQRNIEDSSGNERDIDIRAVADEVDKIQKQKNKKEEEKNEQ